VFKEFNCAELPGSGEVSSLFLGSESVRWTVSQNEKRLASVWRRKSEKLALIEIGSSAFCIDLYGSLRAWDDSTFRQQTD